MERRVWGWSQPRWRFWRELKAASHSGEAIFIYEGEGGPCDAAPPVTRETRVQFQAGEPCLGPVATRLECARSQVTR